MDILQLKILELIRVRLEIHIRPIFMAGAVRYQPRDIPERTPVLGVIGGPASTFNLTDPSWMFIPFILGAIGGVIYSVASQVSENIQNSMDLTKTLGNICQDKLLIDKD